MIARCSWIRKAWMTAATAGARESWQHILLVPNTHAYDLVGLHKKKKAAPPTQSRLTPFHSRNAVGWTWYSRDYLWHAPCKLHGSKSLYACFEALCPIYWKWVLDWIYLGFMSTWFSICDQKTCRLGEGSSFLPCLLPSFHPSILPLSLPSFLPSALPSFTETQKNRKKTKQNGTNKKKRAPIIHQKHHTGKIKRWGTHLQ